MSFEEANKQACERLWAGLDAKLPKCKGKVATTVLTEFFERRTYISDVIADPYLEEVYSFLQRLFFSQADVCINAGGNERVSLRFGTQKCLEVFSPCLRSYAGSLVCGYRK
jgi:hypothetical protein